MVELALLYINARHLWFDRHLVYSQSCPAKRKRALVETNSPRDNRMGWRRISAPGRPTSLPTRSPSGYPELSPHA